MIEFIIDYIYNYWLPSSSWSNKIVGIYSVLVDHTRPVINTRPDNGLMI